MDVTATSKYVRLSASKARDIARRLQGMPVSEGLRVTELSERKAATVIGKTLKSAIANAENNADLAVDDLRIKEAVVNEGPRLKRYWPRSRGMVSRIQRRMCHVRVVLTDGKIEVEDSSAEGA